MSSSPLLVERDDPAVAVIRLNRPDRLNALSHELVDTVTLTLRGLAIDRACRVVIITGNGRGFCAGLDLAGSATGDPSDGPAARMDTQERFAAMVQAIRSMHQPVIAAVNGPAAGAGFALALTCDARVASDRAAFHVAAVKIGLSAGECGISYLLPRHIGAARAFEVMLTGRPIGAAEAERVGLVSQVVPDGEVVGAARALADQICANSPFAIRMTKQVMWANLEAPSFDAAITLENRTQILATFTRDMGEAVQAFNERRPPMFTGE